jgi:hypothetical protein
MRQNLKRSYPWRRLNSTMFTDADFDSTKVPTTTKPTGNGVVDILGNDPHWSWATDGIHVPDELLVYIYGTDAANETAFVRIWGWQLCEDVDGLYVPILLSQLNATLGACTATGLVTSGLAHDLASIAGGQGTEHTDDGDMPGYSVIKLHGCGMLEFDWNLGTAASANALLKPLY